MTNITRRDESASSQPSRSLSPAPETSNDVPHAEDQRMIKISSNKVQAHGSKPRRRSRRAGKTYEPSTNTGTKPQPSSLSPHAAAFVPLAAAAATANNPQQYTMAVVPVGSYNGYQSHHFMSFPPAPWPAHGPHAYGFAPFAPPMPYQIPIPVGPSYWHPRHQWQNYPRHGPSPSLNAPQGPGNHFGNQYGPQPPAPHRSVPSSPREALALRQKPMLKEKALPPPPSPKKLTEEEARAERVRIFREQFERSKSFDDDDEFVPNLK
ncbi:hypothetical protein F5Y02DRAFT_422603 [Annulohypoxylon stygium]|nr:hypothetical protein F5Y02DRAFT_422603 [Annulohypoxylon stygium]